MNTLEPKEAVFLDQSAKALKLTLLDELDIGQFSILAQGAHRFGAIEVEAAVIGASHTIRYTCRNLRLWEVFACTPVQGKKIEFFGSGNSDYFRVEHPLGTWRYEFQTKSLQWPEGYEGAELLQKAIEHPSDAEIALSYTFPCGPFSHAPRTIVRIQGQQQAVIVETVHTYPNEERIVFTSSKLSLRGML